MLTALALIVPVVLVLLFCGLLKLALPAARGQTGEVAAARTESPREPAQSVEPVDRRAA